MSLLHFFFFFLVNPPPSSLTRTVTLLPYTPLFLSLHVLQLRRRFLRLPIKLVGLCVLHRSKAGAGHEVRRKGDRTMRNYETSAFGAVALIAQALVVAVIFAA